MELNIVLFGVFQGNVNLVFRKQDIDGNRYIFIYIKREGIWGRRGGEGEIFYREIKDRQVIRLEDLIQKLINLIMRFRSFVQVLWRKDQRICENCFFCYYDEVLWVYKEFIIQFDV